MPTIEQRIQRLEDESSIRDLAARFADAATRNDLEVCRELFKSDASFKINQPLEHTARGVDDIIRFVHQLRDSKDFFVQFIHSGLIELDGDRAKARWLVREVAKGGGQFYSNFAFFQDELERVDGQWHFQTRSYDYICLDFSPFAGDAIALPEALRPSA